jgi:hypothetical protein
MKTSIVNAGRTHERPAHLRSTGSLHRLTSCPAVRRVLALLVSTLVGGNTIAFAGSAESPSAGDNWRHLSALPVQTRIHVASDRRSKLCDFVSADDEELICSSGHKSSAKHFTFVRAEVRSVKLTRYAVSTLAGAGIGAGAGAIVGAAINSRNKGDYFSFPGIILGITTVAGALIGGAAGGATDFLREPTVYRRTIANAH